MNLNFYLFIVTFDVKKKKKHICEISWYIPVTKL